MTDVILHFTCIQKTMPTVTETVCYAPFGCHKTTTPEDSMFNTSQKQQVLGPHQPMMLVDNVSRYFGD